MKLLLAIPLIVLMTPALLVGQGVRMSPDFLPLEVGNRWVYDVLNEDGVKIGQTDFSIQERTIISGRSFYVVTRFPFLPEGGDNVKLIRYDVRDRQFTAMINDEESALFFDGVVSEVLQSDDSGLPLKFVLQTDTAAVTFQRGVGIVEARVHGADGVRIAKIANVRVGERRAAEVAAAGVPVGPPPKSNPPWAPWEAPENSGCVWFRFWCEVSRPNRTLCVPFIQFAFAVYCHCGSLR